MDSIPQNTLQKQCTNCERIFPATTQYFYKNKNYLYGVKSQCINCESSSGRKTKRVIDEEGKIQCTMCKEWKFPTSEFFGRNNKSPEFLSACKICNNGKAKERDEKKIKKFRHAKPDAITKVCSQCKLEKPLQCFYPDSHAGILKRASVCSMCQNPLKPENLKQRMLPLFKTCYMCKKEKVNQEFYESNTIKDHGLNRACKDCCSKRNKEGRLKHLAERREKDHFYSAKKSKKVIKKKNHRSKWLMSLTENNNRYRAMKLGIKEIDEIDYYQIYLEEGKTCYICNGTILEKHVIAFDHVIPLSRGGSHTRINVKVVHFVCNNRKHARLLSEMTEFQRRGVD